MHSILSKHHRKSSHEEKFHHWFDLLRLSSKRPRNREVVKEYFFDHFGKDPGSFYNFLHFLKRYLNSRKKVLQRNEISNEYLAILSPLCQRFGFFEEKNMVDDLCFRIVNPRMYNYIQKTLHNYRKQSVMVVNKIGAKLSRLINKRFPEYSSCEIKGRYKNVYSTYKKMLKTHQKNILKFRDIFAFRIIVFDNTVGSCFKVLNFLHDHFKPCPDYFKDFITIPKINGYQSIHTGLERVIPDLNLPIEIQIRTKAMDDFAEEGIAAHWLYGQEKKSKLLTEKEQKLIKYLSLGTNPLQEVIYCFSFKGDIFKLEKGSSLVDFAYHIHTELGEKAIHGIVNGKRQALTYTIKEEDVIEIVKSEDDNYQKKDKFEQACVY